MTDKPSPCTPTAKLQLFKIIVGNIWGECWFEGKLLQWKADPKDKRV